MYLNKRFIFIILVLSVVIIITPMIKIDYVQADESYSLNWSGYVISSYQIGEKIHSVSGEWIVPNVFANTKTAYSTTWLGVGGYCSDRECKKADHTLIQVGTDQNVSNGTTYYEVWYELLPDLPKTIDMEIEPGDRMRASISEVGENLWEIRVINLAKNQQFEKTFSYESSALSAEWIHEAPSTTGDEILPLASFDRVSFDNISLNGARPNLNRFDPIVMTDHSGQQLVCVSLPDREGDGFNICCGDQDCSAYNQKIRLSGIWYYLFFDKQTFFI